MDIDKTYDDIPDSSSIFLDDEIDDMDYQNDENGNQDVDTYTDDQEQNNNDEKSAEGIEEEDHGSNDLNDFNSVLSDIADGIIENDLKLTSNFVAYATGGGGSSGGGGASREWGSDVPGIRSDIIFVYGQLLILTTKVNNVESWADSQFRSIRSRLDSVDTKISNIQTVNNSQNSRLSTLESFKTRATNDISSLNSRVSTMASSLDSGLDRLNDRLIYTNNTALPNIGSKIDAMSNRLNDRLIYLNNTAIPNLASHFTKINNYASTDFDAGEGAFVRLLKRQNYTNYTEINKRTDAMSDRLNERLMYTNSTAIPNMSDRLNERLMYLNNTALPNLASHFTKIKNYNNTDFDAEEGIFVRFIKRQNYTNYTEIGKSIKAMSDRLDDRLLHTNNTALPNIKDRIDAMSDRLNDRLKHLNDTGIPSLNKSIDDGFAQLAEKLSFRTGGGGSSGGGGTSRSWGEALEDIADSNKKIADRLTVINLIDLSPLERHLINIKDSIDRMSDRLNDRLMYLNFTALPRVTEPFTQIKNYASTDFDAEEGAFVRLLKRQNYTNYTEINKRTDAMSDRLNDRLLHTNNTGLPNIKDSINGMSDRLDKRLGDILKAIDKLAFDADSGTSIWDFLNKLLDFLEGLIELIVSLVVPSNPDFISNQMDDLKTNLDEKMSQVTMIGDSLSGVFKIEERNSSDFFAMVENVNLPVYGNVKMIDRTYVDMTVLYFKLFAQSAMILITAIWAYRKITNGVINQ